MTITTAIDNNDLRGILDLQSRNLKRNITPEQKKVQGFVSVEHDLGILTAMNNPFPHTIAKDDNGKIVGYVLSMTRDKKEDIPMLVPMIDMIDSTRYDGKFLAHHNYTLVGQVCVDKAFRGKGVFSSIYEYHKSAMRAHFDYLITGISTNNERSMKAHQKVGFEILNIFKDDEGEWANVIFDLKK